MNYIQSALGFLLLAPPAILGAAEHNPYKRLEVIDVEKIISKKIREDCVELELSVKLQNKKSTEITRCLSNFNEKGQEVWLVDKNQSRVVKSFPVLMYFQEGVTKRVIKIETQDSMLDISSYLTVILPTLIDGEGNNICVSSGYGYIEVNGYKNYIHKMKSEFVKTTKNVKIPNEDKIKSLQPWCRKNF